MTKIKKRKPYRILNPSPFTEKEQVCFWEKVDIGEPDECWEWKAGRDNKNLYGRFYYRGYQMSSHRFAMFLTQNKVLPKGQCVLHSCDNPPCCNPNHLFIGTKGDNNKDRALKGRSAKGERLNNYRIPSKIVRLARKNWESGLLTKSEIAERYQLDKRYLDGILSYRIRKDL
jgi:hypothetical protein